jgi:ABC-type multidrug transport system fused ATPase/permease subunit
MKKKGLTPQQRNFKLFAIGALLLLGGLGVIVASDIYLPPSEKQEWIALIALAIASIGAIMAFIGYIKLLLSRVNHFMRR